MNKPCIKSKPSWANYVAQDQSGKWAWFENKPIGQIGGASGYWIAKNGKWENCTDEVNPLWVDTLEEV